MKAVPQGIKKEGKIFTIRIVNPSMIFSGSDFKKVIGEQLNEEITPHDFEICFISGASVIRVHNEEDLSVTCTTVSRLLLFTLHLSHRVF